MKHAFRPFLSVLSILAGAAYFAACSNGQNAEISYINDETIRSAADAKEGATLWTRELESVRLLRDIAKAPFAADTVSLSPTSVAAADVGRPFIFPRLPGFGSLDTTLLSTELADFLNAFCASAAKWQFSAAQFEPEALFSLILFRHDVQTAWQDKFGVPFPPESHAAEEGADEQPSHAVFDSWIFGKPFIDGSDFEIPVRFICKSGFIDVSVFIAQKTDFYINQLQILKWGKKNGT
ncbi:MAG: hypothetical protein K2H09_03055 [Treponemataceae bacterium]|nr:hypothetical protein [Treponemataceae bacterium]